MDLWISNTDAIVTIDIILRTAANEASGDEPNYSKGC